jgi:hypothetical protein
MALRNFDWTWLVAAVMALTLIALLYLMMI